jgi:uncharacterized protein YPO0396
MAETTEIEKKSLEAHVELCAERYRSLDDRLDAVNARIAGVETIVREVHDMIQNMTEKRNDQLINWGLGIIGTMTVIIGFFLVKYVVN